MNKMPFLLQSTPENAEEAVLSNFVGTKGDFLTALAGNQDAKNDRQEHG
jgi:hypothetical protein